jgi:hypothetical protein
MKADELAELLAQSLQHERAGIEAYWNPVQVLQDVCAPMQNHLDWESPAAAAERVPGDDTLKDGGM